ncbi:MAG: hypothetical protein ACTSQK_10705 [Candidatus Heimdallarchaeota archaeon]
MSGEKKKRIRSDKVLVSLKDSLIGGEGLKEVEEKRQKFVEKHSVKLEISEEKEKEIVEKIKEGFSLKTESKDFWLFMIAQFLPLMIIGSALFIPGLIFLSQDLYFLILIIAGALDYLYTIIRLICMLTFKVEFTPEKISWRNIFWQKEIPNRDIVEIKPIQSFYLYFTKIGGVGRFGVEVILIATEDTDYWLRAYPFRKSRGDELVITTKCWATLTEQIDS